MIRPAAMLVLCFIAGLAGGVPQLAGPELVGSDARRETISL